MNSRALLRPLAAAAGVLALAGSLAACSSGSDGRDSIWATATNAAEHGGIDALVEAAEAEGQLNVVALPEDWANYGKIIEAFEAKYDITVNSSMPDASSAEEIQAAENLKGQDTAPDVFDLGTAVALENTDKFAPYQVELWDEIPDGNKEATGLWVNNYSGIMSLGFDSAKLTEPKALTDLLGSGYTGSVAINGDPTQAGAAFAAVGSISSLSGGSVSDFGPGIDFVQQLRDAGNFLTLDPTPATIASGETPAVFDWSFNNVAAAKDTPSWKTIVFDGPVYVSFYNEAINADAPHPAAARLWQEFIFSDEAQALYLEANAVPVRADALAANGAADDALIEAATFGTVSADWVSPSQSEVDAANTLLAERWAAVIK